MKYLRLVWAGLWRKRVRTILTLLSVSVAFLLFGVMHSVIASLAVVIDSMSDEKLRTMSRMNILEPLPLAYRPRIASVPGVEEVSHYTIFFGYYQDPTNGIGVGALDIQSFLDIYPEFVVTDGGRDAMLATRDGALVGAGLASEHGWQVGDRIPITSRRWARADGSSDWDFEVVGIVSDADDRDFLMNEVWINFAYFDEARTTGNGQVNFYFAAIDDADNAGEISASIDELFRNSSAETDTQTDKEFLSAQLEQIGDIEFFVNAIIGAVLFTLLFLTGNTMMQSVRERIPELAVLKTYGFTDKAVIALVTAEALVLCAFAAGIGLGAAKIMFPPIFASAGAPALPMPLSVFATGMVIAVALALISSVTPAWRIRRLVLVDALAGR